VPGGAEMIGLPAAISIYILVLSCFPLSRSAGSNCVVRRCFAKVEEAAVPHDVDLGAAAAQV
jgi:hypothetical protein